MPPTSRTIALVDFFDWNHGGHFRMLFKVIAESLLQAGHRVIAVCQYPEELQQWIAAFECETYLARLMTLPCPNDEDAKRWWRSRYWWEKPLFPKCFGIRKRRQESRRIEYYETFFSRLSTERGWKVDALFFSSFTDYLELPLPAIPWTQLPSGGLWMTAANFLSNGVSVTGRPLSPETLQSIQRSSSIKLLCIHDESLVDAFSALFTGKRVLIWPDVTPEAAPRKTLLQTNIVQRSSGRLIITCIGVMDRRKGVIPLLQAAERLPDCFFVFAGPDLYPVSYPLEERAYFEAKIQNPPENCLFHLERIDDDAEFNAIIAASDVMYVAYLGLAHSSNVMIKAAILHRPIILSNRPGCLSERNRKYNLGIEISEGSVDETVNAIRKLQMQRDSGTIHRDRRYEEFARLHSRSRLAECVAEAIDFVCQQKAH